MQPTISISGSRHNPSLPAPRRLSSSSSTVCQRIVNCVAQNFGIDPRIVIAATRGSPCAALARQLAMYLAHTSHGLDFATVGRLFNRDRTTVSHACCVIEDKRDDRGFDDRVARIANICSPKRRLAPSMVPARNGEPE